MNHNFLRNAPVCHSTQLDAKLGHNCSYIYSQIKSVSVDIFRERDTNLDDVVLLLFDVWMNWISDFCCTLTIRSLLILTIRQSFNYDRGDTYKGTPTLS